MSDPTTVLIRHKGTGEQRRVAKAAVPFFPDYEPVPEPPAANAGTAGKKGAEGGR